MKFAQVSPQFWTDPVVAQWNDAQQKLALYLLTCPHRNLQGLYRLSIRYAAEDLGWSEQKTKRTLERLIEDGFAEYDDDAKVVFLPRTLAYYMPKSEAQVKGAVAALATVPATPLKRRFVEVAEQFEATALLAALTNGRPSHE